MTKRLYLLATICLLAASALAGDVITSQKLWTFDGYSPKTGIDNQGGFYLHSSETATAFGIDAEHVETTSGTFTESPTTWSISNVLTCKAADSNALLNMGNIEADAPDGPEGALAFNFSGAGTLYVVYGATSDEDGTFYILQRESESTSFSTIYQQKMTGTAYNGVFGTRTSENPYTLVEAKVGLAEAGTVFIGGDKPYCIYAIFFEKESVVSTAKSWSFNDLTTGTIYNNVTPINDEYYLRVNQETANRTFTVREGAETLTYTDGTSVNVTKFLESNGKSTAPEKETTAGSAATVGMPTFAINTSVGGTLYAQIKGTAGDVLRVYFTDGTTLDNKQFTATGGIDEVFHSSSKGGSFFVTDMSSKFALYGAKFTPAYTTDATLELTDYSKDRKDFKAYVVKGMSATENALYYILPSETATRTYKDSIRVTKSGTLTYWASTTDGRVSQRKTVNVSLAPRPSLKLVSVDADATNYTLTYAEGSTLYYTLPGNSEKTASGGTTVDLTVTATGTITAYAKTDGMVSDTLKTTVYAPTPAIAEDGLYDFTVLKDKIGDGFTYALNSFPWGDEVSAGGITLHKPGNMNAKTLDRFAFTAKNVNGIETSDWRLLSAGRLRANRSEVADTMAILSLKTGDYVTINYSGGSINYLSQSTAKLAEGTNKLESQESYEITSDGTLLLVVPANTSQECNIFSIQISVGLPVVPTIDNVTVKLTDDTDQTKKVYTVTNFKSGQRLYFMRPQDTEFKNTSYNTSYETTPYTITATTNGYLIYYVTETATGKMSKRDTIVVNSIVARPSATLKELKSSRSIYTINYTAGTTLYYKLPYQTERTASGGSSIDVDVYMSGTLRAYVKNGDLVSDTLKTTVYVKTPAIAVSGKYDFSLLDGEISDYVIGTRPGEEITVCGLTMKKPDDVVENTLDRFAFTARYEETTSSNTIRLRDTDWRLLSAGRLRANKSSVADTMAILDVKKGQYLTIEYSGAALRLMSQSTAKLADSVSVLTSKQSYEILSDGDMLLRVAANTEQTCDIFVIEIAGEEAVTAPKLEARTENGVVVPNAVMLRMGTSNFGKKVVAYYTTDGTVPTKESTKMEASGKITVDESCTIKAVCISETGIRSSVSQYVIDLPEAENVKPVIYNISDMVAKGDTLTFAEKGVTVYCMENNSGWEMKGRSDFMPVLNLDSMVSVRAGASSLVYDMESGTMQLRRAMAIHNLGVGDEVVIIYTGPGSLINVSSEKGNEFTINGEEPVVGEEISSGAVMKITKTKYSNNYIVVNVSGTVYISAIYINRDAPRMVTRPKVKLYEVAEKTSTYRISFDEGSQLYYLLEGEGSEQQGSTTGTYDLVIEKSDRLSAWATYDKLVSDTLTTVVYAPTQAPTEEGDYDFGETSENLPADLEVTLDSTKVVYVNGEELYLPTALTAQTFEGKFAFTETYTSGKIKIRTNRQLAFSRGKDMNMALLNMKRGDVISFDYTGSIRFADVSAVKKEELSTDARTRATTWDSMESRAAYIVQRDGHILLRLDLTDTAVSIAKMFVGEAPDSSEPMAVDFATAGEEEEELDMSHAAMVWCNEREAMIKFKRLANDSDDLPIDMKISSENGYGSMTTNGFTSGNRNIAIHHLAKGDTIKVRFTGGDIMYYGHENYGNRVSVNGRLLAPGDTLHTGDVLKVELVDYLNNYVVLRLGSRAAISGLFINTEEVEKLLMPSITTKTNNTFVVTGGKSTIGGVVTTCYTTDGSEPSEINGISGPYESFEVQVLRGMSMTIKAVSYSESGATSRVVAVYYDGVDLTPIDDVVVDQNQEKMPVIIYDLMGRKVQSPQSGQLYIINGKKVIFNKR